MSEQRCVKDSDDSPSVDEAVSKELMAILTQYHADLVAHYGNHWERSSDESAQIEAVERQIALISQHQETKK